ncbi:MAG: O-antigen ligase family protein [Phycisphaerales bacterium]|nr:MAG: O-antigen ligase family protein [Phycisphaerales bacterium]
MMSVIRIRDPHALRPSHIVTIVLAVVVVGGSSLLLSAAESETLVDGALEWQEGSLLRSVVQLLCLDYRFPTLYAGEIKNLVLGVGAGAALIVLGVAVALKTRTGDEESDTDQIALQTDESDSVAARPEKAHIAPLVAAQVLAGLYLLWSFVSGKWSAAPELAIGGSILLTIHFLWAFAIGNTLSATAGRIASRVIPVFAALSAAVAIWYFYGRNPTIRAKFPFGNPLFLATCLIPGILFLMACVFEQIGAIGRGRIGRGLLVLIVSIVGLAVCGWAFHLTGSRGPLVGLGAGVLAVVFFAVRGKARFVPVVLAIVGLFIAWQYYGARTENQAGRGTTIEVRKYAWSYAMDMFVERRLRGHGQGGFVLAGDSHSIKDVQGNPLAFTARIAHAHNEWLEVLADLGSIGLVLVLTALALTLYAGMLALSGAPPPTKWALIAAMGSLVGIAVAECTGVGLRVTGVPTMFYTMLGLIWAMSTSGTTSVAERLSKSKPRRAVVAVLACLFGLMAIVLSQKDFSAARDTYTVSQFLADGEPEKAIEVGESGKDILNPQRALTNMFYICQAHAGAARLAQQRAMDRERRASQIDPPDQQLRYLAGQDYKLSDLHCERGSEVLGQLVSRSPGYLNHGLLEYQLNSIQSVNAWLRGDAQKEALFMSSAAAALERELQRQPINADLTAEFVSIALGRLGVYDAFELLARPLRHNRIGLSYLDLLMRMAAAPGFDDELTKIEKAAAESLPPSTGAGPPEFRGAAEEERLPWAPECLRLAATIHFFRGDYCKAEGALALAAGAYERMAPAAPLGMASCYSELADARFFSDPQDPVRAIESAERAVKSAPQSEAGRDLVAKIEQRMIAYRLALGEEDVALAIIRGIAPEGTAESLLTRELGLRYASLCSELLKRRSVKSGSGPEPSVLPPAFEDWIARAMELAPEHSQPYYVAATWAWSRGDGAEMESYMVAALERGLPYEAALEFIYANLREEPDAQPLVSLLDRLDPLPPVPGPAISPDALPAAPKSVGASAGAASAVSPVPDSADSPAGNGE